MISRSKHRSVSIIGRLAAVRVDIRDSAIWVCKRTHINPERNEIGQYREGAMPWINLTVRRGTRDAACAYGETNRCAHVLGTNSRHSRSTTEDEGLGLRRRCG